MASVTKSSDSFTASRSRNRVNDIQDEAERENAAYAEKHNLQMLFSEIAQHLSEKDPKTEAEAERALLDFLSQRKAERDRAALRLHFTQSFEVNLDNGRKVLKVHIGQESSTLQLEQKGRVLNLDESYVITLEETEELTELFYELGRFVIDTPKGDQGGFIRVDERDVYFLTAGKDCMEAGDELFNLALHLINKMTTYVPKTSRDDVYRFFFTEGVISCKKDRLGTWTGTLGGKSFTVPTIQVMQLMRSMKSRGLIKEQFAWRQFYWFLNDDGVEYLRKYLFLAPSAVPNTHKASEVKYEREREGGRGRGRGEGGRGRGFRGRGEGGRGRGEGFRGRGRGFRSERDNYRAATAADEGAAPAPAAAE